MKQKKTIFFFFFKVLDEIDDWVLKSLISTKTMFKDCLTKCEKQIYEAARDHTGNMDENFEELLRKNVVMCSTDCTEVTQQLNEREKDLETKED